jgi:predicted transcriptional regulator
MEGRMPEQLEGWVSSTDAAHQLGVSASMLSHMIKGRESEFNRLRVGKSMMWKQSDIDKLAREREAKQTGRG